MKGLMKVFCISFIAFTFSAISVVGKEASNLAPNPSFEVKSEKNSNWPDEYEIYSQYTKESGKSDSQVPLKEVNRMVSLSKEEAHDGKYSVKMISPTDCVPGIVGGEYIPLTPKTRIVFSYWVKITSSSTKWFVGNLSFCDSEKNTIKALVEKDQHRIHTGMKDTGGEWIKIERSVIIPDGVAYGQIWFGIGFGKEEDREETHAYVDDVGVYFQKLDVSRKGRRM